MIVHQFKSGTEPRQRERRIVVQVRDQCFQSGFLFQKAGLLPDTLFLKAIEEFDEQAVPGKGALRGSGVLKVFLKFLQIELPGAV